MDLNKNIYLSNKTYYSKLTTSYFGGQDLKLIEAYGEPIVAVGGTITDGTTSFELTPDSRYIKTQSPIIAQFDTISLGHVEAGKRALAFANVIEARITTLMDDMRALDLSTNSELNKTVTI